MGSAVCREALSTGLHVVGLSRAGRLRFAHPRVHTPAPHRTAPPADGAQTERHASPPLCRHCVNHLLIHCMVHQHEQLRLSSSAGTHPPTTLPAAWPARPGGGGAHHHGAPHACSLHTSPLITPHTLCCTWRARGRHTAAGQRALGGAGAVGARKRAGAADLRAAPAGRDCRHQLRGRVRQPGGNAQGAYLGPWTLGIPPATAPASGAAAWPPMPTPTPHAAMVLLRVPWDGA